VSLFVLSQEIEDRGEVEVDKWANHKKTFYSEYCYTILLHVLFYPQAGHKIKSDLNSFTFFLQLH
jgi:hypothetical protein